MLPAVTLLSTIHSCMLDFTIGGIIELPEGPPDRTPSARHISGSPERRLLSPV
jgi:hypothetical protein